MNAHLAGRFGFANNGQVVSKAVLRDPEFLPIYTHLLLRLLRPFQFGSPNGK